MVKATKEIDIKTEETVKNKKPAFKLDLNKLVNTVRASYGKTEQNLAKQISTGSSISRPTGDDAFVCWKNSPWAELTGIPGLPFGRIIQIAGRPDSGKSTHAMQFMKAAQEQNVLVILWDTEGKFSAKRFDKNFGGDSSQLITISSKMILEGASEIEKVITAAKDQDPDCKILIVWDSVGGSLAKNEGDDHDLLDGKQMASAAKENGAVMRATVRLMEKYKNRETNEDSITMLLINQLYSNIGSVGSTNAGGQKVEYFSSLILQLSRKQDLTKVKDGIKRKIGIVTRAKVKKNHLFDGDDSIAELDLVITAGGIDLLSKQKVKKEDSGFEDEGEVEITD
jgi:RecA/RadA recombinase